MRTASRVHRGPARAITREDKPRKPCPIGIGGFGGFVSPPGITPPPDNDDDEDDTNTAPASGVPGGSS